MRSAGEGDDASVTTHPPGAQEPPQVSVQFDWASSAEAIASPDGAASPLDALGASPSNSVRLPHKRRARKPKVTAIPHEVTRRELRTRRSFETFCGGAAATAGGGESCSSSVVDESSIPRAMALILARTRFDSHARFGTSRPTRPSAPSTRVPGGCAMSSVGCLGPRRLLTLSQR